MVAFRQILDDGHSITIILPRSTGVLAYLLRIGFLDAIRNLGISYHEPDMSRLKDVHHVRPLVSLTCFRTAAEVEQLAAQIEVAFLDFDELRPLGTLVQPCHTVFSELADNVLIHAKSRHGGYVAAQHYMYKDKTLIEIAIADCGVGFRQALSSVHQVKSDAAAIRLALRDRITSLSDPYRGMGLGHVRRGLQAPGRHLILRSHEGWIQINDKGNITSGKCACIRGTVAQATIPCR